MYSVYSLDGELLFTGTQSRCYWYIAQSMKRGFDKSDFILVKCQNKKGK